MRALVGFLIPEIGMVAANSAAAKPINPNDIKQIIESNNLQTSFPLSKAAEAVASKSISLPVGFGDIFLWMIVICGAAVVIWSMRDSLPFFDRSRKIEANQDEFKQHANSNALAKAQIEADLLAKHGNYAEAMHMLLLQSLVELKKIMGLVFPDSFTSREILQQAAISTQTKAALASIIQTVEFTHFGENPATQDDYNNCRGHYDFLKSALVGGLKG